MENDKSIIACLPYSAFCGAAEVDTFVDDGDCTVGDGGLEGVESDADDVVGGEAVVESEVVSEPDDDSFFSTFSELF
jgi:hypothetical protein